VNARGAVQAARKRLDEALIAASSRLYTLNLGARGVVRLEDGVDLTWERHEHVWGLYIRRKPHTPGQEMRVADMEPTALTKSQWSFRLLAARKLPELLADIRSRAAGDLGDLDAAISTAQAFLSDRGIA